MNLLFTLALLTSARAFQSNLRIARGNRVSFADSNHRIHQQAKKKKDPRHHVSHLHSRGSNEETTTSSKVLSFWNQGDLKVGEAEDSFPKGMMDLTKMMGQPQSANEPASAEQEESASPALILVPAATLLIVLGAAVANHLGVTLEDVQTVGQNFFRDPQATLNDIVEGIKNLGPSGVVYFGFFYVLCEILAVPATPLALSAGYLFGTTQGVLVVLASATIAAIVGFVVGRTLLRQWVESLLAENPKMQKLDRAVGKSGFKILVLLRLSPIFPFSLSNYVYGASSVSFPAYFWGTLLGFTPGTIGYVYSGMVGQELISGQGSQPWYIYAAGATLLLGALKVVADVSSDLVASMEDEAEDGTVAR